jgi:hypothetical protein
MKRLVLGLSVLVLAGCGSGMNLARTKLRLTAVNPNVGRAVFHLDCGPAGGDVSDPSAACAALGHDPRLITAPQPFTCLGGPTSWFDVTISGRLAGKPVHRTFSTCWTPQMATLGKLGFASSLESHVLPRRRGQVQPGTKRTFRRGALRPGDLIVCEIEHHRLQLAIPTGGDPISRTGASFGGKLTEVGYSSNETITGAKHVTLSGKRNGDGSITAGCRRGT